jgi:hypothetical protein
MPPARALSTLHDSLLVRSVTVYYLHIHLVKSLSYSMSTRTLLNVVRRLMQWSIVRREMNTVRRVMQWSTIRGAVIEEWIGCGGLEGNTFPIAEHYQGRGGGVEVCVCVCVCVWGGGVYRIQDRHLAITSVSS